MDERKSSGLVQNVKIIAMKSLYTIAVIGVVLSSCSVYRQGQTPDDVYYSPAREEQGGGAGYVQANSGRNDGKRYYNQNPSYSGYDDYATMDDRWLMMRVRNPYRWSAFDDYGFYSPYNSFSSPFGFGGWSPYNNMGFGYSPGWSFGLGFGAYNPYGFGFNNFYNNYWNWNSYYNPYYPGVVIVNPKTNPAGYTRARSFNLDRYGNSNLSNSGRSSVAPRYNNSNYGRTRYNNSNNSRVNPSQQRYYNNNNSRSERPSYNAPREDRPARSYNPSPSPSYSPRSSGGGGGSSPAPSSGSRPSRR